MKKYIALITAAVMLLSLAACGGKTETPAPAQASQQTPAASSQSAAAQTPAAEPADAESASHANADGSYDFIYGWDNNEIKMYTPANAVSVGAGIYDPDFVPEDNVFQGMSLTFENEDQGWYCQARDWQSNTANETDHLAQYYFTGKAESADLFNYKQSVKDLGFKWEGRPVQLIVSTYEYASGLEFTDTFVGVEYDNKTAPDGGIGLLGLDFFDYEITQDQAAYVAGQVFGVDSGVSGDPFDESASAPAAASFDASEIVGSWIDTESTWGTTFTFNSDGSGGRSSLVTGENKPFTYTLAGDVIMLKYSDGLEDELKAEPSGVVLKLTDSFGNETCYEATVLPELPEPPAAGEAITPDDLEGTWLDSDGDGYTFWADGTGYYQEGPDVWNLEFNILNGDQVSIWYDDGDHATFNAEIDGDELILDDNWVMTRQ